MMLIYNNDDDDDDDDDYDDDGDYDDDEDALYSVHHGLVMELHIQAINMLCWTVLSLVLKEPIDGACFTLKGRGFQRVGAALEKARFPNVSSRHLLSSEYRKDAPWLAPKGQVRGVFCGFIIWSVLCLSHFVLFSMSRYFQHIRAIFDRDIMRAYGNYISEMICLLLVMWCCQQNSV